MTRAELVADELVGGNVWPSESLQRLVKRQLIVPVEKHAQAVLSRGEEENSVPITKT